VGNFGSNNRMEYTIVGGQVNIASRLETLADPDSIYISQATYALIQDMAECEFVDNITVKGIHYPIEVYRLVGMKGEHPLSTAVLQARKHGFLLKELAYDASTTGAREKEEIRKALHSALKLLEGGEKEDAP